jgi:hypothetical protein
MSTTDSQLTDLQPTPIKYDPHMDIEYLAIAFSRHFHQKSLSPDFYAVVKKPSQWEIYYTEEPCKTLNEFLPSCRYPIWQKKKYFYKAERLNQHLVVSEVLGHYFYLHQEQIHFRSDPITQINLQWLSVTGHSNPYDVEEGVYLMQNKMRISVLHLVTKSGRNIYLDLCGPQLDLHNYATGDMRKTGMDDPILMLDSIKAGKPYAPKVNQSITVTAVEDSVPITSDEHYPEYLELIIDQIEKSKNTYNDSTQNPADLDPDRGEYLIEYHERLEEEFTKSIQDKIQRKDPVNLLPVSKHLFLNKYN